MKNQIVVTVIFLAAILLLLIVNELVYRKYRINGEITRKVAHFLSTLATITFPFLFRSHWHVLALAVIFFLILFLSRNKRYLKSIHDIQRVSVGSYLLPVAIYLTFLGSLLLDDKYLFIIPMLILAISDPLAGLVGIKTIKWNRQISLFSFKFEKSWLGSAIFFISALIITTITLYVRNSAFDLRNLLIAFVVSIIATFTEMLSWRGSDNLFIPLTVLLVLGLIFGS